MSVPTPTARNRAPRRVLLIDDDAAIRRAVSRLLSADFDVVAVEDAEDAFELLARGEAFDAAIVDLQMPRIDGRATLERLEAIAPALARRAIILTSGASDPSLQAWADANAGRVYRKPPEREVLVAALLSRIYGVAEDETPQTGIRVAPTAVGSESGDDDLGRGEEKRSTGVAGR